MAYRVVKFSTAFIAVTVSMWANAQEDLARPSSGGAESDTGAFTAELSGGASVELVAIIRASNSDNVAWRPDGSRVEFSDEWPKVLRVINQNVTHGFVFRFRGLAAEQGIGWDARLTTPHSGEKLDGLVSVSGSFSETRSLDIRVGLLDEWGPWQATDADGSVIKRVNVTGPATDLYKLINSLTIAGRPKPLISPDWPDDVQSLANLAECEVIAVDTDRVRHKRKGVGILEGQQAPYFDLEAVTPKNFEFRLRPYVQWAEFKNIPLAPADLRAKVNVTVPKL